ncbi:hypothetical protein CCP3SC5AM1_2440002 [Gammaproteobacteria bacterium]
MGCTLEHSSNRGPYLPFTKDSVVDILVKFYKLNGILGCQPFIFRGEHQCRISDCMKI